MEEDLKMRLALNKVQVVYLNSVTDFPTWHLALRRLVKGYNMGDALLFSIPSSQVRAYEQKQGINIFNITSAKQPKQPVSSSSSSSEKPKQEEEEAEEIEEENAPKKKSKKKGKKLSSMSKDSPESKAKEQAREEAPPPLTLRGEDEDAQVKAMLKSFGVTESLNEFFSATTTFVNCRTRLAETDRDNYFRQDIWTWIEASLSRGQYKWLVRQVTPVYDIRALYNKIITIANKATFVSHALEFKKIFTIPVGSDIFSYHAEVSAQIKLVKAQGQTLGLRTPIPSWMEHSLLLIAAWQLPQYRDIALEFTMEGDELSVEDLLMELEKNRLLTNHLNSSKPTNKQDARAFKAVEPRYCFGFQKGSCSKQDCPFLHEKDPSKQSVSKKQQQHSARGGAQGARAKSQLDRGGAKPQASKHAPQPSQDQYNKNNKSCNKCGQNNHSFKNCKYDGICDYCKKKGHKQGVCRKKAYDEAKVNLAAVDDDLVVVRSACVLQQLTTKHLNIESPAPPRHALDSLDRDVPDRQRELLPSTPTNTSCAANQSCTSVDADDAGVLLNVLIAREDSVAAQQARTSSITRWCVDSGANRDICQDITLSNGNHEEKTLIIGEAAAGHYLTSEAVGQLALTFNGKTVPLCSRTIFAKKIHENILSVAEAVDRGYCVVFDKKGVQMYNPRDIAVSGEPIIKGERDSTNRLFYITFDGPKVKAAPAVAAAASVAAAAVEPQTTSTLFSMLSPLTFTSVVKYERGKGSLEANEGPSMEELLPLARLSKTYHEFKDDFSLWHPRMAHVNPRLAIHAKPDLHAWPKKCFCESCTKGKFHKHAHSGSRPAAQDLPWKSGEYVTCDLFGPVLRSMGGARYVAFYVDLKSRFVYAKPLREKLDNYVALEEVIHDLKARSGRAMRFFKSDGDSIFTGEHATSIFNKFSIRHIQSAPGDSASNDIAERTIRTFAELTTTNLLHAGAPPYLWAEAMSLVCFVWNNLATMPHPSTQGEYISRLALLEGHQRKFDLSILRAFGTQCYWMLTVQKKGGKKLAMLPKAQAGVIVGVEDNMPAYRVLDLEKRSVRKIPFAQTITHEGCFPFRNDKNWSEDERKLPNVFIPSFDMDLHDWMKYELPEHPMPAEPAYASAGAPLPEEKVKEKATAVPEPTRVVEELSPIVEVESDTQDDEKEDSDSSEVLPAQEPEPRRALRETQPVNYKERNIAAAEYRKPIVHYSSCLDRDDCSLPAILSYRSNEPPPPASAEYNLRGASPTDPKTKPISIPPPRNRRDALLSPWWPGYYEAELVEMASHAKNGTWQLIPRSEVPPGTPILRDRWVYDDKLAAGGKVIERFKARLTAMGCFQKEGIDYTETYASVMSTRTFRILLQMYNDSPSNTMEHWDVSTAFVHAPLKEKVYMRQASGHEVKGKEDYVYLLVKALYGTKQAARAWQLHLRRLLVEAGFTSLILDPSTYVKRDKDAYVIVGTHVDDLFVLANQSGIKERTKLWEYLSKHLSIKTLGEAKWTLKMLIERDSSNSTLKISQESFVVEILQRFSMNDCKSVPTPAVNAGDEATMQETDLPTSPEDKQAVQELPFYEVIGCLWWLAQMTRLDIFVALQRASHWVSKPSFKLWRWLVRILKYLSGTRSLGLTYRKVKGAPPLCAYVDAAFADNENRRSTAGWVFFVHGNVTAYDSHTIKRVVTSSTEAECSALTIVGKENQWQRQMYEALTGTSINETPIHCDNTAAISLTTAGVTKRSRHFDIEWFKFQDLVENRELKVQWVPTDDNVADFFTKKLAPDKFTRFRDILMGATVSEASVKARRLVVADDNITRSAQPFDNPALLAQNALTILHCDVIKNQENNDLNELVRVQSGVYGGATSVRTPAIKKFAEVFFDLTSILPCFLMKFNNNSTRKTDLECARQKCGGGGASEVERELSRDMYTALKILKRILIQIKSPSLIMLKRDVFTSLINRRSICSKVADAGPCADHHSLQNADLLWTITKRRGKVFVTCLQNSVLSHPRSFRIYQRFSVWMIFDEVDTCVGSSDAVAAYPLGPPTKLPKVTMVGKPCIWSLSTLPRVPNRRRICPTTNIDFDAYGETLTKSYLIVASYPIAGFPTSPIILQIRYKLLWSLSSLSRSQRNTRLSIWMNIGGDAYCTSMTYGDYRKSSFLKNYFDLVILPWTLVIPGTFRIQFLTFWWSRLVQQTNIDLERVFLVFLTHFRLKHVMTEFMWTQETDMSDTALKRALLVRGNRPLKRLLTTIIDGEKDKIVPSRARVNYFMRSDFERLEEKLSYFFLTQFSLSERSEDTFLHQFFSENPNLASDLTHLTGNPFKLDSHFSSRVSIRRPPKMEPILKTPMTNIGAPLSRNYPLGPFPESKEVLHDPPRPFHPKYGPWDCLLPYFPSCVKDWEGRWLVRMVSPPFAQLLADGVKPFEIMPIKDWILWGTQGFMVVAIYQGASRLANAKDFMPDELPMPKHDHTLNGKIIALIVLGPVSSPQDSEQGWYYDQSPSGAKSSMHRVLSYCKLDPPYAPSPKYTLGGGFQCLSPRDIKGLMLTMIKMLLKSPDVPLFSNGPRPVVENFNLSFLERDFNLTSNSNVNDYFFPAHVELLPEYGVTPSLFRLPRSTAPRVDFWRKPATEHAAHVAKTGKPIWPIIWESEKVPKPWPKLTLNDYHASWPGPLVFVDGHFEVDFALLPSKRRHVTLASVTDIPAVNLNLVFPRLMFDDVPPHVVSHFKQRHLSKECGKESLIDSGPTTVYTIRYLKTIDEALKDGGYVFWLASDGQAHLPLGCGKHFKQIRNQENRSLLLIHSDALTWTQVNFAPCCRDLISICPLPFVCVGRMHRECVETQVGFLAKQQGGLPPPFQFSLGLFKPKTDEDEFLEWVRMKQDQIASIQSEIVQKTQEFYAHRK